MVLRTFSQSLNNFEEEKRVQLNFGSVDLSMRKDKKSSCVCAHGITGFITP